MTLRLVSYNIRFGGQGRGKLIAEVLRSLEPDLVVLQEATDPRVVESIAAQIGMTDIVARPGHSVAALNRVAMDRTEWHRFRRGRAMLELSLPQHGLRVFGLHLSAGMSWRGERVRIVEAGRLLQLLEGAAPKGLGAGSPGSAALEAGLDAPPALDASAAGGPAAPAPERTLIVGDFNAIAPGDAPLVRKMPRWIRLLLRFDGGIHTRAIQMFLDSGFVDGFRRLHPDELGFTLPAVDPSVRLDYLMIAPDLVPGLAACAPVQPDGLASLLLRASDHLPLLVVLETPG